jgi:hypothetical protein
VDARITAAGLAALVLLGTAGCTSGGQPQPAASSAFLPSGSTASDAAASGTAQASAATAATGYVMPPFGPDVHVDMTSWTPAGSAEAAAVNADKDFQLAYLYAQYKGGQDDSWTNYVAPGGAQDTVSKSLEASAVTTESFKGTVKYFDMSIAADATTKGGYDVLGCFDSAGVVSTSLTTGAVAASTSSPDMNYARFVDVLLKDAAGQWQVVSSFPTVYYPKAPECKP